MCFDSTCSSKMDFYLLLRYLLRYLYTSLAKVFEPNNNHQTNHQPTKSPHNMNTNTNTNLPTYTVLVLGAIGVGKTSLSQHLTKPDQVFQPTYTPSSDATEYKRNGHHDQIGFFELKLMDVFHFNFASSQFIQFDFFSSSSLSSLVCHQSMFVNKHFTHFSQTLFFLPPFSI